MKDLNFFESYIDKKRLNLNKSLILFSIIIIWVIFISCYYTLNQTEIKKVNKEIDKLKITANDEMNNEKLIELIEKKQEVKKYEKTITDIKALDDDIEKSRVIDYYFLDIITSKMSDKMFFNSLRVDTDNLEIIGVVEDKNLVASFVKNVEVLDMFEEVFISNITKESGYFDFDLNINLKDVSISEESESFEEENNSENESDEK